MITTFGSAAEAVDGTIVPKDASNRRTRATADLRNESSEMGCQAISVQASLTCESRSIAGWSRAG
jgi:hypothetical protein